MEKIKVNFVSLQRILRICCRLKESGGEIDKFEINTLQFMFRQCNEEEQLHMIKKYGEVLEFLKEKPKDAAYFDI